MNARDNILRVMSEAGAGPLDARPLTYDGIVDVFGRFADLVIADFLQRTGQYVTNDASRESAIADAVSAEREACAQACQAVVHKHLSDNPRLQSEQHSIGSGASLCVDAIRART